MHGRVSRALVARELGRLRSFGVLASQSTSDGDAYARACPLDRLSEIGGLWVSRHFQALAERAWDSRTVIGKPEKFVLLINALVECADRPEPVDRTGLWTRPRG